MLRVFIGYDSTEHVDFHVLVQSIIDNLKEPVSIVPLCKDALPMWRAKEERQSTEFSFSRFLVPFLCQYKGQAIFMDSDMVVKHPGVFEEAFRVLKPQHAVACVQHDYMPIMRPKFHGVEQHSYPRKNWSSFMAFNCWHPACRELTPVRVNNATPAWLHQLRWCDDSEIAPIPMACNVLVDEPDSTPRAAIMQYNIHYTRGSPMHPETVNTAQAEDWIKIYNTFRLPHLERSHGDIWKDEVKNREGNQ